MSKVIVLGAAGALGRHVVRQAVAGGHAVTSLVRDPARLPDDLRATTTVVRADLATDPEAKLGDALRGHDVLVNTAGHVSGCQAFVDLVDRIVRVVESLPAREQPVCWFLAGAALLDLDDSGRRGVDLPRIASTYWPHRPNFDRLRATGLDWRLLCPGPMVEGPAVGIDRMRIATDTLPVRLPSIARTLPGFAVLPLFASRVPEMIVPYADAAALMLANLDRGGAMSRRRIGLALPVGMRGSKAGGWAAKAKRSGA